MKLNNKNKNGKFVNGGSEAYTVYKKKHVYKYNLLINKKINYN